MTLALLRNLPVVLLACAGYFLFFGDLWGAWRPWMAAPIAAIVVTLSLALDLRDAVTRTGRARRRERRSREDEMRAAWPAWRRGAAVIAGVLIVSAGIYGSFGRNSELGAYPLLAGLCFIVSAAVGVLLVLYGWPRARWVRRPKGERPPADSPTGAGFQVPVPKDMGHAGFWGGVGTRPGRQVWKPGGSTTPAGPPEHVPRRFRHLRLLRRKRR